MKTQNKIVSMKGKDASSKGFFCFHVWGPKTSFHVFADNAKAVRKIHRKLNVDLGTFVNEQVYDVIL